jgi:UDP-N-acetylmuramoylalanine--D-glutamate ligase
MGSLKEYLNSLKNKRVAVVGVGVSNRPLVKALSEAGIDTTVRDKRTFEQLGEAANEFAEMGAKLVLGDGYLSGLNEDIIFRTPGLMPANPLLLEAVKQGTTLTGEMEVFFGVCPCKIIAVTGSDGKTTTTTIIAELLKKQGKAVHLGGNIGTPLLCDADDMEPDDFAVVELSSFQLITMKKSPDTAVVTNVTPNHLDVHTDMDEYVEAKRNIVQHQKKNNRAVLNLDNEITYDYASSTPADDVLFFSRQEKVKNGVYLENGRIFEARDNKSIEIMRAEDIFLSGIHNTENYLAAFAAVQGIVSHEVMRDIAQTFRGVQHRLEFVRELRGVKYYNDSIASGPTRTIAGLRAFEQQVILIAGGKDKGISFGGLGDEVAKRVKKLILTGKTAEQINDAVVSSPGYDKSLEIQRCDNFTDAVQMASKLAVEGDIVLLSPACTSFDSFANFEERGNTFKDIVNRLV